MGAAEEPAPKKAMVWRMGMVDIPGDNFLEEREREREREGERERDSERERVCVCVCGRYVVVYRLVFLRLYGVARRVMVFRDEGWRTYCSGIAHLYTRHISGWLDAVYTPSILILVKDDFAPCSCCSE